MTEENTNQLPAQAEIPEFLQKDDWFSAEIDADMLDFDEPYRPPRYTMERGGVPFADVGELHLVSGKPGNGKTGLMSQLEATTLSGQFGGMAGRKVKHRIRNDQGEMTEQEIPARWVHIDTEQGKDDTIAFKNRVCSMAGMSSDEAKQHFFILRLRDTEKAVDRWRKILKAIYVVRPTDIFIDGLLDIVEDYNDQKECQPIIRKCMMLATEYDASLWAVLHENPMVDKLVGTLGSIAQRKVSEIFVVIKVKQSELKESERRPDLPDIYFRVKQVKARGRDVADWLFRYETNVGGWGQPVELDSQGGLGYEIPIQAYEDAPDHILGGVVQIPSEAEITFRVRPEVIPVIQAMLYYRKIRPYPCSKDSDEQGIKYGLTPDLVRPVPGIVTWQAENISDHYFRHNGPDRNHQTTAYALESPKRICCRIPHSPRPEKREEQE